MLQLLVFLKNDVQNPFDYVSLWVSFAPRTTKYYVTGPSAETAFFVANFLPTQGSVHVDAPCDPKEKPIINEEFVSTFANQQVLCFFVVYIAKNEDESNIKLVLANAIKNVEARYEKEHGKTAHDADDAWIDGQEICSNRLKFRLDTYEFHPDGRRNISGPRIQLVDNVLSDVYEQKMKEKQNTEQFNKQV